MYSLLYKVTESEDVSNSFKEELELVSGDVFTTLSFTVSNRMQ